MGRPTQGLSRLRVLLPNLGVPLPLRREVRLLLPSSGLQALLPHFLQHRLLLGAEEAARTTKWTQNSVFSQTLAQALEGGRKQVRKLLLKHDGRHQARIHFRQNSYSICHESAPPGGAPEGPQSLQKEPGAVFGADQQILQYFPTEVEEVLFQRRETQGVGPEETPAGRDLRLVPLFNLQSELLRLQNPNRPRAKQHPTTAGGFFRKAQSDPRATPAETLEALLDQPHHNLQLLQPRVHSLGQTQPDHWL